MNEKFEQIRQNYSKLLDDRIKRLTLKRKSLLQAQEEGDAMKIKSCTIRINSILKSIDMNKLQLSCMRPHTVEDLQVRQDILKTYAKIINDIIPNSEPVVFHGNGNIGIVERIIKSGGLFTPEQRGIDFQSFATLIDVAAKTNIRVSLEFADNRNELFLPYGAIFVFLPKDDEIENVLNTGNNTEVSGGVDGINFRTEANRFIGIITTDENIERLRKCCLESGVDANKVFTHEGFIEFCKSRYKDGNIERK